MESIDINSLNGIYKDIAESLCSVEIAKLVYLNYKGLQITFPTRFFSKEYIEKKILEEYDGANVKKLAIKFGYSERWVRSIIRLNNK